MQILNRIYSIYKSASLLAVVFMLAFTVPMSTHAKMMDDTSSNQHEMNIDQSNHTHDVSVMEMTSSDSTDSSHAHDSVGCCETGLCITAALVDNYSFSEAEQIHTHIALPTSQMTSAGKSRLMRPPSL